MRLHSVASLSDTGRLRQHNEDSLLLLEELRLFAVADGMGGLEKGEIASATAIATLEAAKAPIEALLKNADSDPGALGRVQLAQALDMLPHVANDRIQAVTGGSQSGTTLVAGLMLDGHLLLTHVGDSRAYLYRDGSLRCLTEDQTVAAAQFRAGLITMEEHDASPYQHMLYQALGTAGQLDPDLLCEPLAGGDILLLCSDGLTGPVSDVEIEDLLTETEDLSVAAKTLIQKANDAGGPDNITVVLARTADGEPPEDVESRRQSLRGCPILKNLNDRDIAMLSLYLDEYVYGEGHVFESELGLHVIINGTATLDDGRVLEPGVVFGLTPFLDGGNAIRTVTASSDCTIALLGRGCYSMLKERRPSLAVSLLHGLLAEVARRNREA